MIGAVVAGLLPAILDLASLLGIAVGALGSLVVVAAIAVYLLRNRPRAFLSFRKLRPEPDRDDDSEEGRRDVTEEQSRGVTARNDLEE